MLHGARVMPVAQLSDALQDVHTLCDPNASDELTPLLATRLQKNSFAVSKVLRPLSLAVEEACAGKYIQWPTPNGCLQRRGHRPRRC